MTQKPAISRKQRQLIAELMVSATLAQACKKIGISDDTGRRWLALPQVKQAYDAVLRDVFDLAQANLQQSVNMSINVLKRHMLDKETPPAVQVRAAQIILDKAFEVVELKALRREVDELKQFIQQQFGKGV